MPSHSIKIMVSIITPVYNRAELLQRLYESLCRQTCKDFEWIVVDDGSAPPVFPNKGSVGNSTKVAEWSQDVFETTYVWEPNGGKHTAVNLGVKMANGELVFIADSDDWLPDNAIEEVEKQWKEVKDDPSFGGVCGLDGLSSGGVIIKGNSDFGIKDCSFLEFWWKYRMKAGDMKEVYRTSVMREFPFPEIAGERFCPEELVWSRIARKYKLRYFSKGIYIADYQPTGISANMAKVRMGSPIHSMMMYQENVEEPLLPLSQKVRYAINYWRFRCCYRKNEQNKDYAVPKLKWYWMWTAPLGFGMHLLDIRKGHNG